MADNEKPQAQTEMMSDEDVLSELRVLSKKYGLPFENESKRKTAPVS